jgi:hypothetical protein
MVLSPQNDWNPISPSHLFLLPNKIILWMLTQILAKRKKKEKRKKPIPSL